MSLKSLLVPLNIEQSLSNLDESISIGSKDLVSTSEKSSTYYFTFLMLFSYGFLSLLVIFEKSDADLMTSLLNYWFEFLTYFNG